MKKAAENYVRSISPGPNKQRLEVAKSMNPSGRSPMTIQRSLSSSGRDMNDPSSSSSSSLSSSHNTSVPDFRSSSSGHAQHHNAATPAKLGPSASVPGAPLNAAAVVSLVNTAVPSLAKAFTWKKGKEGAEEDGDCRKVKSDETTRPALGSACAPTPVTPRHSQEQPKHRSTLSDGSLAAPLDLEMQGHDCVMGVLSKWINLGRGWGPRLFVLEGGVLSYFKLDGPDKVSIRGEMSKYRSVQLLGDEIRRWVQKEKEKEADRGGKPGSFITPATKPLGTVHLLVSNIRESRSEDKKFYVYSGTKTLDVKADSREERSKWVEILRGAKLRIDETLRELDEMEEERADAQATVRVDAQATVREDAVSKLLRQLREGGLTPERVSAFEDVLRNDVVGGLQKKLREEQRRRWQMQRRIKELETEKLQLESAVVEESRSTLKSGALQPIEDEEEEGNGQGSDDGDERQRGAHGDEDEEDEREVTYFEALSDFMEHSGRLDSSRLSMSEDMESVGFDYPLVKRRASFPAPVEEEKPVSLWAIIKDCVGKDVSRITLPVFFNEPISTLQKCAEEMEYSWLLDRAAVYGKQGNQLMRAMHVAAFALSGYASTEGRVQKPFNPLLGETFEAEYPDKGWRFVSEKMQHNPNVVACSCEGRGWTFWGDCNMRIRFWGPSMQLDPLGVLTVEFEDGESYEWSKVTTGIYNLILGKLYIDHYGTMNVQSNRNGMSVKLKFKERSMFDRNIHQVQGYVQDESGRKLATLMGKWSEHLYYVLGDVSGRQMDEKELHSHAQLLWRANARSEKCGKYKFTPFVVGLNEITPGLKEHLPPTDSRLRPDQKLLELGRYEKANEEKLRLEQKQREARKMGEDGWHGRYFQQKGPHNTWTYGGGYWEKRAAHDWSGVKEIFSGGDYVVSEDTSPQTNATENALVKSPSH